MVTIKKDFLDVNPFSRPGTKLGKVKGVVIHWYGNPKSRAQANRNYWNSLKDGRGVYASAHYCIDEDGSVVQALPESELAYQVGSPKGYTQNALNKLSSYPNNCVIGIENAHPDTAGKFYDKDYTTCIELAADILKRNGLTHNDLWRHSDIVGKAYKDCPRYYTNNESEWIVLKEAVRLKMAGGTASKPANPTYTVPPFSQAIGSIQTKMEMNLRKGPGVNYAVTKVVKKGTGLSAFESKNGWYRVSSGEWISGGDKYIYFNKKSDKPVVPSPVVPKKQYVYFPPKKGKWSVYPTSKPAQKQYAKGQINPDKFGGLTYPVLKDHGGWVFEISTDSFGRVKVYCHPDTGALTSWNGPGKWPNVQK
ncbi:SH3 domain-containing protein [Listeria booriae]|uniref:N-acetylmuramoyl-L-alanine amidase n=1 Tax=Listeria booriae TaxID=1552123 RepID=UPI001626FE9C|nr:N-acetylmuramoyl-L-alanine amidase [Listeria booriae]MBC2077697.1 SH3 domain-containing protein [Listeria booriae]